MPFVSAASASAVCSYCRSTVLRDGDTLRRIGISAELFDDHTPLQLGVTGKSGGAGFTLVGRVQYGYGGGAGERPDGTWNEWHALFDDGRSGWLSEDNDRYVLVFDIAPDRPPPPASELRAGETLSLEGIRWTIASVVEARALAAQGELPKLPAFDAPHPIADLRNEDQQVATLDYADPAQPQFSFGRAVQLASLQLQGLRTGPDAGTKTVGAQGFPCPNCGAPVTPQLSGTQAITCGSCKSLIDLSSGPGADLRALQQTGPIPPRIPLGRTGRLAVAGEVVEDWQVVGFAVKASVASDPGERFVWHDYLLYNETEGFAFLIDSQDGWVGFRTLTGVPTSLAPGGGAVSWNGDRYRLAERYPATVRYVEGEFYWKVEREQLVDTADYIGLGRAAQRRLSREEANGEIVWSQGSTLEARDIEAAFRLDTLGGGGGEGVAALRPDISPLSGSHINGWVLWLVVIIALLVLMAMLDNGGSGTGTSDGSYYGSPGGTYGGYSSGGGHK